MNKLFIKQLPQLMLLLLASILVFTSCEKDSDGSPDVKPGNMQSEGITPGEGAGGAVITLKGSGLGDIRSIVFDKGNVPAIVTSTLNTEGALVFRVPDTANGGTQNIIFTNSQGMSLTLPFNVVAMPSVTDVSNYNFNTDVQITLTGNNLNDVSKVVLEGTTTEATIVSQTRKQLVIKMPATTLSKTKLKVTNATGSIVTNQEFYSIPNNFVLFADDWGSGAYNSGVQSWSWDVEVGTSATEVKSGTTSLKTKFKEDGGLSLFLGSDWGNPMKVFTDWLPTPPKYLSFWAKALDSDVKMEIITDSPPWDGTYSGKGKIEVTIPKDVWTYFKIPNSLTGKYGRMNIILRGSTEKVVYFDDMMFLK
jgi:hypothetical protein